jgi:predicted TPR repeat methyltransferase
LSRLTKVFEDMYRIEDPWKINNSVSAKARSFIINEFFRGQKFKHLLDIGCGEGLITGSLDFADKITALDISPTAID